MLLPCCPASKCGSEVADALAGDKSAVDALQTDPEYCQVSYPDPAAPEPIAALDAASITPPVVTTMGTDPTTLVNVGIAVAAILYFVPVIIAFMRRKRNAKASLALDLFPGWTFLAGLRPSSGAC